MQTVKVKLSFIKTHSPNSSNSGYKLAFIEIINYLESVVRRMIFILFFFVTYRYHLTIRRSKL